MSRLPFAGLFLAGAGLFGLWIAIAQLLLLRLRVTGSRPSDWLATLDATIRPPRPQATLLVGDDTARPLSWGIAWPTILLPRGICRRDNEGQVRAVLLHEAAHIRHRDAWSNWLMSCAMPLLYWNPLYWKLRSEVGLAIELLADDWAAQRSGRTSYIEELTALAKATASPRVPLFATNGLFSNRSRFYRRMQMLLERETPLSTGSSTGWRLTAVATSAAIVTAAALLAGATSAPAEENAPRQARSSQPTRGLAPTSPARQEAPSNVVAPTTDRP